MSQLVWHPRPRCRTRDISGVVTGCSHGHSLQHGVIWMLHEAAQRIHIELSVFAMIVRCDTQDSVCWTRGSSSPDRFQRRHTRCRTSSAASPWVRGHCSACRRRSRLYCRETLPATVGATRRPLRCYAGFAFGTIHAAAIGTDLTGLIRPLLGPSVAFLVYVLLLRQMVLRGMPSNATRIRAVPEAEDTVDDFVRERAPVNRVEVLDAIGIATS